jgi:hypothetical protein
MRPRLFAALLAVAPALVLSLPTELRAAAPTGGVRLVRVWPEWRAAESFARLSEYFGGGENTGGQTVLRSQPKERAGYYFLVRTEAKTAVAGARIELRVLLSGTTEPKTFSFAANLPAGTHVTLAGLTGADWPGEKTTLAAWRVALLAADGTVLAEEKSFLWSDPTPPKK